MISNALEKLRSATEGTSYEGKLYLVGGVVRDKVMGLPEQEDIDIVLEGDAASLADFMHERGVAQHTPVVYPRFGTAMVTVCGRQVELVGARSEKYDSDSRKPDVASATLRDDMMRRDFTINTLLENLHTGEILDLLGCARLDIERGVIRTPGIPTETFSEDPLRMLRAVRFASRFGFTIESETYDAIVRDVQRLSIISNERIRDELTKIVASANVTTGLELLRQTGLLSQFAPELVGMHGVGQNNYHIYDCWTHTLKVIDSLPEDASLRLKTAALFHDIGKPGVRSVDDAGNVHFYSHQVLGAELTRNVMSRLRFSNDETDYVSRVVALHLRVGEYSEEWSDAAVRRLIREASEMLPDLITLTRADKAASNLELSTVDVEAFIHRAYAVSQTMDVLAIDSPLCGNKIMEILGVPPGPILREAKEFLINEILENRLRPGDEDGAARALREKYCGLER